MDLFTIAALFIGFCVKIIVGEKYVSSLAGKFFLRKKYWESLKLN